jgi:hypothetical protein
MIFHFAHQSSNPTTPAMESVSAVGFPRSSIGQATITPFFRTHVELV